MKSHSRTIPCVAMATRAALLAVALAPFAAQAASVSPISYDMPNGDGQASGGSFNYWDGNYTGSGNKTSDGAALSGGLGALTDGVVSVSPWQTVSNNAGTGQYVGWYALATPNPVVTFNFASSTTINTVTISLDNTIYGGVYAPTAILIDGVSQAFTAPAQGSVGSVVFTGLNFTGLSHTVEFDQLPGTWTFVSEVSFEGVKPVPLPAALWLLGPAIGSVLGLRRRTV